MKTLWTLLCCAGIASVCTAAAPIVLEGEKVAVPKIEIFRDERASGEKSAGIMLEGKGESPFVSAKLDLPAGDYVATFWMEAVPTEVLHHLAVVLSAGDASIRLGQINFDTTPGYQPFAMAFFHPGGQATIQVMAGGSSGFDGMRKGVSEQEQQGISEVPTEMDALDKKPGTTPEDAMDILEGERNVKQMSPFDRRLLCDKIEIATVRLAPVMVTRVSVDKVHYLPGETVKAAALIQPGTEQGALTFLAEDITELDSTREVFSKPVQLVGPQTASFEYMLKDREFGHEIRCSLLRGKVVLHSKSEYFGVSRNVYRIGITGGAVGHGIAGVSQKQIADAMQTNKKLYANYFEKFAWAPCDYSELTPDAEFFWSGQTQYPGSITGFKNLLNEAHKVGVKGITYGKSCAGGIAGFNTYQKHPEFFGHGAEGPGCEAMSVFFLERMLANDYSLESAEKGGWQHWASIWCDWSHDDTVEFGAQAIMDSIEMFGWDGIRWDGHFVGRQQPFLKMLRAKYPNFVHGYNIAFANPGSALFMPPDTNDFLVVAADHGLLMDESVRDWSHSNFSPGWIEPFYGAICREGDYEKRIGGLPLFIMFDMASRQDHALNVLFGLAAGQRYTYNTSPGDFSFGPLPKFLTRYSAFVWDDTKRVAKPESVVTVKVNGQPSTAPWWKESVWLRDAPDSRQQVLIHMVNPPLYSNFAARVQTTPVTLTNLTVRLAVPAGATLERVFHVSPDLVEGHTVLKPVKDGDGMSVTIPRMRSWSIVGYELSGGPKPAFPLTTPVEDALAVFAKQAEEAAKKVADQKAKAGIGPTPAAAEVKIPYYKDYSNSLNADLEFEKKMEKPKDVALARNGVLDVHHAHGAFNWLNPVESAAGMVDAPNYQASWVDFVGFKASGAGCMDEFPDTYEQLMSYDVLVLDNIQALHLGAKRRVMVADFVRNGGGLLVFGGYWNLSLGADHNTYIEDLLPVTITGYKQIVKDNNGLALKAEKPAFFDKVDWASPMQAFTVDLSPVKDGAEVLATIGGKPAIVARPYGKGRVIVVLFNGHGNYAADAKPYWLSPQWPRIIASCLKWLGEGSATPAAKTAKKKQIDPTKTKPADLAVEAFDLDSKTFTAKLKEAKVNMVDADSAQSLLEAAVDNIDKVADMELLAQVADEAKPYFDKSMAPLGEKLSKSDHEFIREAGFQILGLAGDPKYRMILEDALRDPAEGIVREALIGLGRIADPLSVEPTREYLRRGGKEKLLAFTVLVRLGDKASLKDALPAYQDGVVRRVMLKCGRFALIDTLWGGVSFKLTPEQRKRAMREYYRQLRREVDAKFDVTYFNEAIRTPTDDDLKAIVEFLAIAERREVLPMAYAVFNRLPPDKAKTFKPMLADAKLAELKQMAGK